jgi:hypothetical protein
MARELATVEITDTELLRLAREVRETGRPRVLRHAGEPIAVLMPPPRPSSSSGRRTRPDGRTVLRNVAIVERTAGALRRYAMERPLTPREERDAFERGVAGQVTESMEG